MSDKRDPTPINATWRGESCIAVGYAHSTARTSAGRGALRTHAPAAGGHRRRQGGHAGNLAANRNHGGERCLRQNLTVTSAPGAYSKASAVVTFTAANTTDKEQFHAHRQGTDPDQQHRWWSCHLDGNQRCRSIRTRWQHRRRVHRRWSHPRVRAGDARRGNSRTESSIWRQAPPPSSSQSFAFRNGVSNGNQCTQFHGTQLKSVTAERRPRPATIGEWPGHFRPVDDAQHRDGSHRTIPAVGGDHPDPAGGGRNDVRCQLLLRQPRRPDIAPRRPIAPPS